MKNDVISEKLAKLEEIVKTLEEFKEIPRKEFVDQRTIYFGAVYALVIGVEIVCDIGNHILSYYFGRKAETYKDIIELLAEVEIIPAKFARRTEDMTDFRNLAIHVYARVDPKKVYHYLPLAIKQFQKYTGYFLQFLEKRQS